MPITVVERERERERVRYTLYSGTRRKIRSIRDHSHKCFVCCRQREGVYGTKFSDIDVHTRIRVELNKKKIIFDR